MGWGAVGGDEIDLVWIYNYTLWIFGGWGTRSRLEIDICGMSTLLSIDITDCMLIENHFNGLEEVCYEQTNFLISSTP